MNLSFTVYGRPVPQGSTKAFYVKSLGRAVVTSDNTKLKPWRQELSATMQAICGNVIPRTEPVSVRLDFYFDRPKSVSKKRVGMTVKPDVDKLVRAVFDAMTGTLIEDDSQIVDVQARKHYGIPERVEVSVRSEVPELNFVRVITAASGAEVAAHVAGLLAQYVKFQGPKLDEPGKRAGEGE